MLPLVALMKDQVGSLLARGISAAFVGADYISEHITECNTASAKFTDYSNEGGKNDVNKRYKVITCLFKFNPQA